MQTVCEVGSIETLRCFEFKKMEDVASRENQVHGNHTQTLFIQVFIVFIYSFPFIYLFSWAGVSPQQRTHLIFNLVRIRNWILFLFSLNVKSQVSFLYSCGFYVRNKLLIFTCANAISMKKKKSVFVRRKSKFCNNFYQHKAQRGCHPWQRGSLSGAGGPDRLTPAWVRVVADWVVLDLPYSSLTGLWGLILPGPDSSHKGFHAQLQLEHFWWSFSRGKTIFIM